MQFYDTDLQSDHPKSDMHSEKEMPKEKLLKQKLLHKTDLFRVKKEILNRGINYQKPAYFDLVSFKIIQVTEEQYNDKNSLVTLLIDIPIKQQHIQQHPEWIDKALSSMKREQQCVFSAEYLKYDENDLKVLDHMEYYLVEMIEWITYIDLYQDQSFIKKVIKQGSGPDRCELCDEINIHYTIKQGNELILEVNTQGLSILKECIVSRNVKQILKTMKNGEHSETTIKNNAFKQDEYEQFYNNINEEDLIININLKQMIKIDDIYHDGIVVKKCIYKGRSTAKPEKVSLIHFDLWIYRNTNEQVLKKEDLLYSSVDYDPPYEFKKIKKQDLQDNEYGSLHLYIDDLKVSKLMRMCLLRMKKNELAVIKCFDSKCLVKNGVDFEGINEQIPQELVYVIHVFNFSEGKNNFNMTIDEKIEQAIRKRQVGLCWISQQNYKKALKVFKATNAYFDYGTFSEEDKIKMREFQIQALLNTSLCQMKIKDWINMKHVTSKLFALDNQNPKIIYRHCYALKQLYEYPEALTILKNTQNNNPDLIQIQKEIQELQSQYFSQQKKVFSKLFDDQHE